MLKKEAGDKIEVLGGLDAESESADRGQLIVVCAMALAGGCKRVLGP